MKTFMKNLEMIFQKKISQNDEIVQLLKFLVQLTTVDDCFQNMRIKNCSLMSANFKRCNLSGSEFQNVDSNGINLNGGGLLFNCSGKTFKYTNQINQMVIMLLSNQVCSSPDGTTLASGGNDNSIRLCDVKTGQYVQPSNQIYKELLSNSKFPCFKLVLLQIVLLIILFQIFSKN